MLSSFLKLLITPDPYITVINAPVTATPLILAIKYCFPDNSVKPHSFLQKIKNYYIR